MKNTDKNKPIPTIPDGVWESRHPVSHKDKPDRTTPSTDLQGNGYPKKQEK